MWPGVLIFKNCQDFFNLLLNFCQIPSLCSYKHILIRKEKFIKSFLNRVPGAPYQVIWGLGRSRHSIQQTL